jgi:hypothetical protein
MGFLRGGRLKGRPRDEGKDVGGNGFLMNVSWILFFFQALWFFSGEERLLRERWFTETDNQLS